MHAPPVLHARLSQILQQSIAERDGSLAPRTPFPRLVAAAALVTPLLCSPPFDALHSTQLHPPLRAEMLAASNDQCSLAGLASASVAPVAAAVTPSAGLAPPAAPSHGASPTPSPPHALPHFHAQQPQPNQQQPHSQNIWANGAHAAPPRQSPPPPPPAFAAAAAADSSRAAAAAAYPGGPAQPYDRNRDVRDREATLRQAANSGFAPKRPSSSASSSSFPSDRERDDPRSGGSGSSGGSWNRGRGAAQEDEQEGSRYKRQRGPDGGGRSTSPTEHDPTAGLGSNPFVSGSDKLLHDQMKKHGSKAAAEAAIRRDREAAMAASNAAAAPPASGVAKSLGGKRKGFVPPYAKKPEEASSTGPLNPMLRTALAGPNGKEGEVHPKLQGCDPKLVEMITFEMMESPGVRWDSIAGLEFAKKSVREIVVWPILRPDMFTGLRGPPKGLLLFGPPGTGKTLIGKAIASESRSKFFSISASSLTSKWHGEGEKLVRTLFAVAQVHEPSIIFIDEIDSLLSQRQESEFEASRRIKTEFLIQMDGANMTGKERVLVVGATNRPQELDEAARRRLVKKLYIPLPDAASRMQLLRITMAKEGVDHRLSESDFAAIVDRADGYSGSDMAALCTEASMGPIRSMSSIMDTDDISSMEAANVRPIELADFEAAFQSIRPSVNVKDLAQYIAWNKQYGSFPMSEDITGTTATDAAAMAANAADQKEKEK